MFINNTVDTAIKNYLESKNDKDGLLYNSFLVVVIRLLCKIYDELDIINPYLAKNVPLFVQNLEKYGYSRNDLNLFVNNLYRFEQLENMKVVPNPYFVTVQKQLIDMFCCKKNKINISNDDQNDFRNNLFSSKNDNSLMISYNFLNSKDPDEVINYFDNAINIVPEGEILKEKHLLSKDAYGILKIDYNLLLNKNEKELEEINNTVYRYFQIDVNDENKDTILNEKVKEYMEKQLTSGNGYVDILLVMGIIFTVLMAIAIITFVVF